MTIEEFKTKLCDFGSPQIVKKGIVFTVLITGKDLSKSTTVVALQSLIIKYAAKEYPIIEVLKNDDTFFCMILKTNL